jgi:hypothetical protein
MHYLTLNFLAHASSKTLRTRPQSDLYHIDPGVAMMAGTSRKFADFIHFSVGP